MRPHPIAGLSGLALAAAVLTGCATTGSTAGVAPLRPDPVEALIVRAEACLHFAGEEPYDAARRAEIEKALIANRCETVVADGDALKASHPKDAARIETSLSDLRA